MTPFETSDCILRLPDVKGMVRLSKTSLYARIKEGTFPAPISLGGQSVGWLQSEVVAWINARIAASRPGQGR